MTVRLMKLSPILKQYIFNWSWLIMVFVLHITRLQSKKKVHMRCLHLPRRHAITSSYVFPYDCSCIADGYEKRRMCLHCLQLSCELYVNYWGTDRNKSVRRLNANPYGDWTQIRTEIERKSVRRLNANPYGDWMQIRTEIERKSYGAYAASMQRLSGDNTIYFDKKSTENRTFAARSSRERR